MTIAENDVITNGNAALRRYEWVAGDACGALLIVHGFGEHAGRYERLARNLNKRGISVYAADLRGHGNSSGKRGVIRNYEDLLSDVDMLADTLPNNLPKAIYGHSMGGGIVLSYLLSRKCAPFSCAVISSPWLRLEKPPSAPLCALASALGKILPDITLDAGLNMDVLSRDPNEVESAKADPLRHSRIGARLFTSVRQKGEEAIKRAGEITLPMLLVYGDADSLVSTAAIKEFATRCGDNLIIRAYAGGFHEVHNDLEETRDTVMVDIRTYLNAAFETLPLPNKRRENNGGK